MFKNILAGLKKYLSEVLQDVDGAYSSKRFVGIFGAVALFISLFLTAVIGIKIAEFMFHDLTMLVMSCLGMSTAEKFSPFNKPDNKPGG